MTPTTPNLPPTETDPHGPPAAMRRWWRPRTGVAVLGALVALGGVGAAALQWPARSTASTAAGTPQVPVADAGLRRLEAAARARPDDAAAWADLGAGYVDHARVNSDPSAYRKAERALDRSLALNREGNWEALAAHASLAAGRHDFTTALRYAEPALALQPTSSFIRGVLVDALTELGRYPEAVRAAQDMVDLRPDLRSYSRVSYLRELHGDIDGAITAMQAAHRAASAPGDRAFALFHLGELEWNRGAVDAADGHYLAALRTDPTAMQALAGRGKVAAARGDLGLAIERYEEAVTGFPDPDAFTELGDLHLRDGRRDLAERAFARSARANASQAAGGVDVDLEIALFSADHRRDLDRGLAAARAEWSRRQSVHVADALAWQLFAHGRYGEALVHADAALALGTRNAGFHFHRAEIHRALGNRAAANADYAAVQLINPHFSVRHEAGARRQAEAAR